MFAKGTRVQDRDGDTGTVLYEEGGRVYVDGDAGTSAWSYWPHELHVLCDEEGGDTVNGIEAAE